MHMIALCACVSTFVSLCVRACARARAAAAGDHRQSCFKCERQSRLASQPHPPLCPSPNREGPTAPPHLRTRRRRGGHTVPNPSSPLRRQGGWVGGGGVRACVFACERARACVCLSMWVCVCVRAGFVSGGGSRLRLRLGVRGRAAAVPTEWGTRDRLLFCLRRKVQPLPPAEPRTLVRTGARCDAGRCAFTCALCALRADFYILQAAFYMLHLACCLRLHGCMVHAEGGASGRLRCSRAHARICT